MTVTEITSIPEIEPPEEFSSPEKYANSLAEFDAALCEGSAVYQKINDQLFPPSLGFSTHVFARILAYGRNIMRSVPRSKWCSADYVDWDFGANAGSFRSILEASLLFHYLYDAYFDPDDGGAAAQLMHLYDLKKRETIFYDGNVDSELDHTQEEAIVDRLTDTTRFLQLPPNVQKNVLKGKLLMLESKEEIIQRIGWDRERFYLLWKLTSQYAHVYSLPVYRSGPNGYQTGMENDFDRGFLALGLETCALMLEDITDILCKHFPDAEMVRNGAFSKFSSGPYRNLPQSKRRALRKRRRK